jgi:hypothetical protein
MTYSDAAGYAGFESAKDDIVASDLPLLEKLRRIKNVNDQAARAPKSNTVGKLLSTAIGVGLGLGVAKGVGSLMGLSDDSQSKINWAGAAFGGLMGLSKSAAAESKSEDSVKKDKKAKKDKNLISRAAAADLLLANLDKLAAEDRKNAFRLGFMKAAKAHGYFTKTALNPLGLIIDPIVGAGQAARSVGSVSGSGLAMLDSYDDTDEDIMKMQVEAALLKQQLAKMQAEKKSKLIKRLLDSRVTAV